MNEQYKQLLATLSDEEQAFIAKLLQLPAREKQFVLYAMDMLVDKIK